MSAVLKEKELSDQEHADFVIAIKSLLAIETTDQLLQWMHVSHGKFRQVTAISGREA